MAIYRRIDGKIVSVVFDLKCKNGKKGRRQKAQAYKSFKGAGFAACA